MRRREAHGKDAAGSVPEARPRNGVHMRQRSGHARVRRARGGGSSIDLHVERFIDELAARAGVDAVAYRRGLLHASPRAATVLDVAAARAHWDRPVPAGHGRGVALQNDSDGLAALVVEVEARPGGLLVVHRVVCALSWDGTDDPDVVQATLRHRVSRRIRATFAGTHAVLPAVDPCVEVVMVPCGGPTCTSDTALACMAPALASAAFAATGRRPRIPPPPRRTRRSPGARR